MTQVFHHRLYTNKTYSERIAFWNIKIFLHIDVLQKKSIWGSDLICTEIWVSKWYSRFGIIFICKHTLSHWQWSGQIFLFSLWKCKISALYIVNFIILMKKCKWASSLKMIQYQNLLPVIKEPPFSQTFGNCRHVIASNSNCFLEANMQVQNVANEIMIYSLTKNSTITASKVRKSSRFQHDWGLLWTRSDTVVHTIIYSYALM